MVIKRRSVNTDNPFTSFDYLFHPVQRTGTFASKLYGSVVLVDKKTEANFVRQKNRTDRPPLRPLASCFLENPDLCEEKPEVR
jgi:hypothetical protein